MERSRSGDPAFLITLTFAIALVVGLVAIDRQCTAITLVSSNEKSALLSQIASEWSRTAYVDWRCAVVNVVRKESGRAEAALARGWDDRLDGAAPDVWSPAASSWTLLLRQHLADRGAPEMVPPVTPLIMQSPHVIAMPEPMAKLIATNERQPSWSEIFALAVDPAGWSRYGRPDLGAFRLARTDPTVSTSGLHLLIGAYVAATNRVPIEADVQDPVVRDYVRAIERKVLHDSQTVAQFLHKLREADARGQALTYFSAIAMEEKQVWDYNRGVIVGEGDVERPMPEPSVPLVAIYPREGTFVADHPYVILDAPWAGEEKRRVAAAFLAHLHSRPVQERFARNAFRDHLGHAGPLIERAPGLSAAGSSRTLTLPHQRALERIQRSWSELRGATSP